MCPRIKKWAVFIHTLHIIRNGVCHFGISKKLMRKWCKLNTNTYYYYNKKIFRPCTTFYTHELVDNFYSGFPTLWGIKLNIMPKHCNLVFWNMWVISRFELKISHFTFSWEPWIYPNRSWPFLECAIFSFAYFWE